MWDKLTAGVALDGAWVAVIVLFYFFSGVSGRGEHDSENGQRETPLRDGVENLGYATAILQRISRSW